MTHVVPFAVVLRSAYVTYRQQCTFSVVKMKHRMTISLMSAWAHQTVTVSITTLSVVVVAAVRELNIQQQCPDALEELRNSVRLFRRGS